MLKENTPIEIHLPDMRKVMRNVHKTLEGRRVAVKYKNNPTVHVQHGGVFNTVKNASYNPITHEIRVPREGKKFTHFERAVLGHELGHARNWARVPQKYRNVLIRGGNLGLRGGSVGGAIAASSIKDPKQAKRAAILGTAMTAPRMADELLATGRMLKRTVAKHGVKGLAAGRFGALRMAALNMGSYGIAAGMPMAAYGVRRLKDKVHKYARMSNKTKKQIHYQLKKGANVKNLAKKYDLMKGDVREIGRRRFRENMKESNMILTESKKRKIKIAHELLGPPSPDINRSSREMVAYLGTGGVAGALGGAVVGQHFMPRRGAGGVLGGIIGAAGGAIAARQRLGKDLRKLKAVNTYPGFPEKTTREKIKAAREFTKRHPIAAKMILPKDKYQQQKLAHRTVVGGIGHSMLRTGGAFVHPAPLLNAYRYIAKEQYAKAGYHRNEDLLNYAAAFLNEVVAPNPRYTPFAPGGGERVRIEKPKGPIDDFHARMKKVRVY